MKVVCLLALMMISVKNSETLEESTPPNTSTPLEPLDKDKHDMDNTIFQ